MLYIYSMDPESVREGHIFENEIKRLVEYYGI